MLAIIDCNIGNIGSLLNAFSHLGHPATVVSNPSQLVAFDSMILPGVGAFDTAIAALRGRGFVGPIREFASSGRPVFGICLGLHVLCDRSEEGSSMGLGLVPGSIQSLGVLGCTGKVPHVGFNGVSHLRGASRFLASIVDKDFYFVHSYALAQVTEPDPATAVAHTDYDGVRFVSALQRKNIFATQFHPEKSGEAGLALLSEFISCSRSA